MLRPVLAAALSLSLPCLAQENASRGPPAGLADAPTGLTATVSIAGGGDLGLEHGEEAGVFELEATIGWEFPSTGIRPELGTAFGLAPDGHIALRPGVRVSLPGYPIQLRAALDAANARERDFGWRWLLLGVATELRLTSLLGLYAEVDTGAKLSSGAGIPLLVRAGGSLRF